jgi:hypothetical protein
MPLDFPNSPSLNATFTTESGRVWVWDGSRWESLGVTSGGGGSGSITVSETAPEDANEGDLWFNSVDTNTYIYYDDFWVQTSDSQAGPEGPQGDSGVVLATEPLVYNAQTKTISADSTVVITTANQTLTNKTVTSARLNGNTAIEQVLEDVTIVASAAAGFSAFFAFAGAAAAATGTALIPSSRSRMMV